MSKKILFCSSKKIVKNKKFDSLSKLLISGDFKNRIVPYIKKTKNKNGNLIVVALDKSSEEALEYNNIKFVTPGQYFRKNLYDNIEKVASRIIDKGQHTFERNARLKEALNYILSDQAQSKAANLGFVPLSGEILQKSRAAVTRIGE